MRGHFFRGDDACAVGPDRSPIHFLSRAQSILGLRIVLGQGVENGCEPAAMAGLEIRLIVVAEAESRGLLILGVFSQDMAGVAFVEVEGEGEGGRFAIVARVDGKRTVSTKAVAYWRRMVRCNSVAAMAALTSAAAAGVAVAEAVMMGMQ